MSREIPVHHSKTLKLSNCLLLELSKEEDFEKLSNLPHTVEE